MFHGNWHIARLLELSLPKRVDGFFLIFTSIKAVLNIYHTFCCSVVQLCPTLCDPHQLQHTSLLCPLPSPGVCSISCPLSWWCHPTISFSVVPFSCLQSFPASGSFPRSQLFVSCGQSIGASASASVLPVNNQNWVPLGLAGLISLQSKELSRVFSNTTLQKHQFFGHTSHLTCTGHTCTSNKM